ncbi:hypothetical protein J3B02_001761 [Coemansia erecta]|uniref:Survival Motor Neuron Gemin2-binding domain-containing protein n=1 Tax=Coemansia asiatica TaxID=1052880 RepID=A0A9W7XKM8_9FUNG|nr:hypothetical protein LPJ64_003634 [Coemansia asiatica]KAJ2856162.1 hypothetical protein J3B02_001761 [Coemansia erecta]KAJ2872158.1 hypothetical protein FB639_004382 [Coemansia asiatica]
MSTREIVSYDDLYSEEEHNQGQATAQNNTSSKKRKPKQPVTIESRMDADDDSCTSSSSSSDDDDDEIQNGEHSTAGHSRGDWDDTDLLRAWDSTISEYRREHALLMNDEEYKAMQHRNESRVGKWADVRDVESAKKRRIEETAQQEQQEQTHSNDYQYDWEAAAWPVGSLAPPQSEDDALHKLITAWYSAGYYAGYYQAFRSGIGGNGSSEPCTASTQSAFGQQESDDVENEHE